MDNVAKLSDAKLKAKRAKKPSPPGMPNDIYERIDYGRDGPKASPYNLHLMLSEHPDWAGVFGYDELKSIIVKRREPPCGGGEGDLTDVDVTRAAIWFSDPRNLGASIGTDLMLKGIAAVAEEAKFHPVREYIAALTWDRVDRLDHLFADICGADQDEYTARVGVMLLVAAVARVFQPGCRVHFMVVLEGLQQKGKSSFVRELFGPDWTAESMESPSHKDFYQSLRGLWGVEIAEMHSFNKADVNKVKQAITQASDYYRPSYGKLAQRFHRQCVLVGTTNQQRYLTDPTGALRFLPIRTREFRIDALMDMRDQLWAEAYDRFRHGEQFWRLPAQALDEQEARFRFDSWEEVIAEYLVGKSEVTTTELMEQALKIDIAKHTRQDQMRVADILTGRLGWEIPVTATGGRQRVRSGDKRSYVYKKQAIDEGEG